MWETVLNVLVVVAILGAAGVATQLFASAMYKRCPFCQTLNAKRRPHCRSCRESLTKL